MSSTQVEDVLAVIGDGPGIRRRVQADLKRTKSVEATINNFFEGQLAQADEDPDADLLAPALSISRYSATSAAATSSKSLPPAPAVMARSGSSRLHIIELDDNEDEHALPEDNIVIENIAPKKTSSSSSFTAAAGSRRNGSSKIINLYDIDDDGNANADQPEPPARKRSREAIPSLYDDNNNNIDLVGSDDDEGDLVDRDIGGILLPPAAGAPPARKRPKKAASVDDILGTTSNAAATTKKKRAPATGAKRASSVGSIAPRGDDDNDYRHDDDETGSTASSTNRAKNREKIANVPPKKLKKVNKDAAIAQMRVVFDVSFVNDPRTSNLIQYIQKGHIQAEARELSRRGVVEWHRDKNDHTGEARREKFVVVAMSCAAFADLIRTSPNALSDHVERIKSAYSAPSGAAAEPTIITYAIWAPGEYYAEAQNAQNREYAARAQNNLARAEEAAAERRALIPKSKIEQQLVWLQINKKCRVRKLESIGELANYLIKLTEQIAQKPYKAAPAFDNFCAEAVGGRASAARTVGDAFKQALTRINGLSDRMAEAITSKYSTMKALLDAYEVLPRHEGETLLASIEFTGDKTTRKIGPAMSKLIHTVFTATDGDLLLK